MKSLLYVICFCFPVLIFAAKAPDFTITDYNNKVHHLYSDYLNQDKVVVLKLFFVDCPPCNSIATYVQEAYVRWGAGQGKVQFIELSTQTWDNNSYVKSYAQKHGITFPGAGNDGGSITAVAPYKSGTFGQYYGTPTFVVISPDGEVNFDVKFASSNQAPLDTAIAQALRTGGNNGGNPGECVYAFTSSVLTSYNPSSIQLVDLQNGNPSWDLPNGSYNCEFPLSQNVNGYYVQAFPPNDFSDLRAGVSTADIVLIQKDILGISKLNNLQKMVADVNNSNSVSASDISVIRKLILGLTNNFPKLTASHTALFNPFATGGIASDKIKLNSFINTAPNLEIGIGKFGDVTDARSLRPGIISRSSGQEFNMRLVTSLTNHGTYKYQVYLEQENLNILSLQFYLKCDKPTVASNLNVVGYGDINSETFFVNLNFKKPTGENFIAGVWTSPLVKTVLLPKSLLLFEFESSSILHFSMGNESAIRNEVIFKESPNAIQEYFTDNIILQNEYTGDVQYKKFLVSNSDHQVHIESKDAESFIKSVVISDLRAGLVSAAEMPPHTKTTKQDITGLPAGCYLISIEGFNGFYEVHKIVKY